MTPGLRKLALTAHVVSSVGWLGALAGFLALSVAGLVSRDAQMVRATCLAMGVIAWFVILPLSLASLMSGLVQALGTPWGLFRHHWVLAKLLLTVVAILVLLMKLGPIRQLAEVAAETAPSSAHFTGLRISLTAHAGGGLLVLLAATTLSVFKPRGVTRYGMRKQGEQGDTGVVPGLESTTGTPRWVKVFGGIVVVLILLLGIMVLGGRHGPGAHIPSGG